MALDSASSHLTPLDATLTREWLLDILLRVLNSALSTVQSIHEFPEAWNERLTPQHTVTDQAVSEVGVLLLLASRAPNLAATLRDLTVEIAKCLVPLARTNRQRNLLIKRPERTAYAGIAHVALERLGFPDPIFDKLIRSAFEYSYIRSYEKLPFRTMDERWAEGLLFPERQTSFDDLLSISILSGRAHPIYMEPYEPYALTHAVMYLTDFGMRPLPLSFATCEIDAKADACIASNLLNNNLDLLTELVICSVARGVKPSPYVRYAWAHLRATWERLGYLPSPTYDAEAHSRLPGKEGITYFELHTYHSTFLFGVLASILLSRLDEGCPARQAGDSQLDDSQSNSVAFAKMSENLAAGRGYSTPPDLAWTSEELACELRHAASRARTLLGHKEEAVQATKERLTCSQGDVAYSQLIQELQIRAGDVIALSMQPDTCAAARLSDRELAMVLSDALLIKSCKEDNMNAMLDTLLMIVPHFSPLSISGLEALHFLLRQLECGAMDLNRSPSDDTHFSTREILSMTDRLNLLASTLESPFIG